ncbi:MAG: GNAT family N-acetyltransferase [Atopobiaceae bacterium]|nr:GNAT family N-acetyltransferase [Atopobiaceae bacterium]
MLDTITKANASDFDAIWQLYADVCEHQAQDAYGAKWTIGVYPTESDIRAHIDAGELYVGWSGGQPVAAMVLVGHEDPEYASVPWKTPAADDEVAVIHLLAVHPHARGLHAGAELVHEATLLSRAAGKRVMHLDVVPGNLAASHIYVAEGYELACTYQIYYEDTGLADFEMYELVL